MKRKTILFGIMVAAALMTASTIIGSTESNDWESYDWDHYTYPYTWCFMDKVIKFYQFISTRKKE